MHAVRSVCGVYRSRPHQLLAVNNQPAITSKRIKDLKKKKKKKQECLQFYRNIISVVLYAIVHKF
jgi:hypothetical protein